MESQTTECTTSTDNCGELTVTVSLKGLCCNTGCGCGCQTQQPTDPCPDPVDPDPVDPDPVDPDPVDPDPIVTITTTQESDWGLRGTVIEAEKNEPWAAGVTVTPTQVFNISPDRNHLQIRDLDFNLVNEVSLPAAASWSAARNHPLCWGGPDGNLYYVAENRVIREMKTDGTDLGELFDIQGVTWYVDDMAVDNEGNIYISRYFHPGKTYVHKYTKATNSYWSGAYAYTGEGATVAGAFAIDPETGNFWIATDNNATYAYLTEYVPELPENTRALPTENKRQIDAKYARGTLSIVNGHFYASSERAAYEHDLGIYGIGVSSVIMNNIGTLMDVGDTFVLHPQETTLTVKRIMNDNQVEVEEALTDATFEGSITVNS